jgi:hypothetical protein
MRNSQTPKNGKNGSSGHPLVANYHMVLQQVEELAMPLAQSQRIKDKTVVSKIRKEELQKRIERYLNERLSLPEVEPQPLVVGGN